MSRFFLLAFTTFSLLAAAVLNFTLDCLALKREALHTSTTPVTIYRYTRCNTPEHYHLPEYPCENLK